MTGGLLVRRRPPEGGSHWQHWFCTDCVASASPDCLYAAGMNGFSEQNIYQMWFESEGAKNGLWITRTTWSSIAAHIVSVGEPKGPPPYYGNPVVLADIF